MSETLTVLVDGLFRQGRHNLSVSLVAENGAPLPAWQPGAHIDVHLRAGLVRQYSLTGDSTARHHYHICVARDAQSRGGSHYVHETLRPGQRLTISAPRNLFPLAPAGKVILLAAGIGITPLYAMMQALEAGSVPFALHYYVKQRGDAAFLSALSVPFRHGSCQIWYSDEGHSPRCHLPDELREPAGSTQVYLCGPAGFMTHLQQQALALGWPASQLHTEAFKPAAIGGPASTEETFSVTLARSGQQFTIPADRTIASVLLEQNVAVPLSCEMGMCGACLTRVIEGEVDHRDTVQSAAEKSSSDQAIALCCSRARSAHLLLDM